MISAALRAKLLATSGVTALVSTRVYVDYLPQSPTLPAISIHPVSQIPNKTVDKGSTARIQVSCWSNPSIAGGARSPSEVTSVAAAVKAVCHKAQVNMSPERWTVGSTSFNILSKRVTGMQRMIVDPSGWYHVPIDVELVYQEV